MAKKVKITQKELKSPDQFRETVSNSIVFLSENYRKLLLLVAVAVITLIAVFAVINQFEKKRLEANLQLTEALDEYRNGKPDEALPKLTALMEEYPDLPVSEVAAYYAGSINYDLGKYDQSITLLDNFLKGGVDDPILQDAAYLTIGLANFNLGKWQEAIDNLSRLNEDSSPYENQAKLHIGMSLEKLGKADQAEEIYKEMVGELSAGGQGLSMDQPAAAAHSEPVEE